LGLGGGLGALGGGLGALGGGLGALGGGLGFGGGLGGGLGALGVGGLGALGGGLGALGVGGFGGALGAAGFGGGFGGGLQGNFQGGTNLGFGGGALGFGGGQLGQLGNLGGQFGIQGGNTSQILIITIRSVVGRPKDWLPPILLPGQQQPNALPEDNPLADQDGNQIGFYPPAMALVVKATSRIHLKDPLSIPQAAAGGGAMGALDNPRDGHLVIGPKSNNKGRDQVAKIDNNKNNKPNVVEAPKGPPADPKTIWQDALAKGVDNPALIIATADFLALNGKWEHAAEFLKANLRLGIVIKPWVYESLAIALKECGGSTEEIERAEVASADLQPLDANGFVKASRSLGRNKHYDRAVAFCRQAALIQPSLPSAYEVALDYAELGNDARAMEWAAGNLLKQDWPAHNKQLQDKAAQKLEALTRALEKSGRAEEVKNLRAAIERQRQRDLVIKLVWKGNADLDLKVKEPSGSVCSALNRMTVGGGTLIGDTLADMNSETYVAPLAFSGAYEISVDRVWGEPVSGEAQLKIIRHQGTKDETEKVETIKVQAGKPVKINLADGRRREAAYVPPPEVQKASEATAEPESGRNILTQLRDLANPEITGYEKNMSGSTGSLGMPTVSTQPVKVPEPTPNDRVYYQTRVAPFVKNSADVVAQAVISADRRYVRLSLNASFNGVTGVNTTPVVVNPIIPGGGNLP
jgi:tetratricopeptide (TPR) repeat protein